MFVEITREEVIPGQEGEVENVGVFTIIYAAGVIIYENDETLDTILEELS
jgi:hypothetical protein